jgi:DNA-binding transcriptional LysR family regulator
MDWDDLRLFLQLSRTPRMVAAAKALGVDDSTVARRIARLEKEIGAPLVERAGRRTVITEQGIKLAEAAEEIESIVLRKIVALVDDEIAVTGRVRVGAPEGFGVGYLGQQLALLSAIHEGLETELVALPRTYSLAAREVDIAVTLDRPTAGQITAQKLTDYTLDLYGTEAYFRQRGTPKKTSELSQHVFAGYIPDLLFTEQLNFLRLLDGIEISARIRSTSVVAQLDAVDCGAAIGILPTYLARKRPNLQRILSDSVRLQRSYWISVHDDLRRLRRIQLVLKAITDAVRADRKVFVSG